MQEIGIFELNLSEGMETEAFLENAINELDRQDRRNLSVKLKLDNAEINQSQLIFIKSLIESYGHKLVFVETKNENVRDLCIEMNISTTNPNFQTFRLESQTEQEKPLANTGSINLIAEEKPKEFKFEEKINFEESRQTMGVYRNAEENRNKIDLYEENVDFYAAKSEDPVVCDTKGTMYVNQTVRNGQIIDYDGNVVIIGDCHPGSEIKATGDITVWGVLGSIAHAGIKGNKEARIRALKMNAVQLRIADCYSRRPDGSNIPYIVKSPEFTPEEARIVDDGILLFKMTQN